MGGLEVKKIALCLICICFFSEFIYAVRLTNIRQDYRNMKACIKDGRALYKKYGWFIQDVAEFKSRLNSNDIKDKGQAVILAGAIYIKARPYGGIDNILKEFKNFYDKHAANIFAIYNIPMGPSGLPILSDEDIRKLSKKGGWIAVKSYIKDNGPFSIFNVKALVRAYRKGKSDTREILEKLRNFQVVFDTIHIIKRYKSRGNLGKAILSGRINVFDFAGAVAGILGMVLPKPDVSVSNIKLEKQKPLKNPVQKQNFSLQFAGTTSDLESEYKAALQKFNTLIDKNRYVEADKFYRSRVLPLKKALGR